MLSFAKKIIKKHPSLHQSLVKAYNRAHRIFVGNPRSRLRYLKFMALKAISDEPEHGQLLLNVGGGQFGRPGWRVLDVPHGTRSYFRGYVDYEHDLCTFQRWPVADGQVRLLYTSHTLEHIHPDFLNHNLNEAYRVLASGGAIRISVPDYDLAADAFERGNLNFFLETIYGTKDRSIYREHQGSDLLEYAFVYYFSGHLAGKHTPVDIQEMYASMGRYGFADQIISEIPRELQGVGANIGRHVNWFNFKTLNAFLEQAGFADVYLSKRQGSKFKEMVSTSNARQGEFDNSYREISVYVEAIK